MFYWPNFGVDNASWWAVPYDAAPNNYRTIWPKVRPPQVIDRL